MVLDRNGTGRGYNGLASCTRCMVAPKQPAAVSVVTVVGRDGSKWWCITVFTRVDLNLLKASGHAGDHRNGAPFFIKLVRGFAIQANPSL